MRIQTQIKAFLTCLIIVSGILAFLGLLLVTSYRRESETNSLLKHSADVASALNEFGNAFDECESESRSLINFGSSDGDLLKCRAGVMENFDRLKILTKDNSTQIPNLDLLKYSIEQRFKNVDRLIEAYKSGGNAAVMAIVQTGSTLESSRQVNASKGLVQKEESRLLIERGAAAEESRHNLSLLIQAVFGLLIISIILSVIVIWNSMKRQRKDEDRLRELYKQAIKDSKNAVVEDFDFNELMDNVAEFLKGKTEVKQ